MALEERKGEVARILGYSQVPSSTKSTSSGAGEN